tara:strand:+ start:686 stop:1036 length:351 start_codon:yes stop_codon:yes gene_type:complete
MSSDEKHVDPSSLPDISGGKGGLSLDGRESLRMIKQAVTNGWDIPAEWKGALPGLCMTIAMDELRGDRERLRAVEILRAMQRDNLDAAQVLDKVERLDVGQATERIELGPIEWKPQ